MIGANNHVTVLDFGIGSLLAENEGESLVDTMSTANTLTSGLDCCSPESIMEPTNRTPAGDQYSLGCTLYFCLTGRYPFAEGSAVEKMMAHQFKDPTPLKEVVPDVPDRLAEIVERLMKKNPDDRYRGLDEVVEDLQPLVGEAAATLPGRVGRAASTRPRWRCQPFATARPARDPGQVRPPSSPYPTPANYPSPGIGLASRRRETSPIGRIQIVRCRAANRCSRRGSEFWSAGLRHAAGIRRRRAAKLTNQSSFLHGAGHVCHGRHVHGARVLQTVRLSPAGKRQLNLLAQSSSAYNFGVTWQDAAFLRRGISVAARQPQRIGVACRTRLSRSIRRRAGSQSWVRPARLGVVPSRSLLIFPDRLSVHGLSAHGQVEKLFEQVQHCFDRNTSY